MPRTRTSVSMPEFRAQQDPSNYPFSDTATLRNGAGAFFSPGTFLGAALYPIGGQARLYVSRVSITHNTAEIFVGDPANAERCSGQFDLLNPPTVINLTDSLGRPAGMFLSDANRLTIFQAWGVGEHRFTVDQSELVATVCMPTPEIGVRGILLDDGSLFTGDVWLVGDDGVVLRHEMVTVPGRCGGEPTTHEVIRVDVVGDPLFRRRLCSPDDLFETPRFVRGIRFKRGSYLVSCEADDDGNVAILVGDNLASDTVMRIRQTDRGIVFETAGTSAGEE